MLLLTHTHTLTNTGSHLNGTTRGVMATWHVASLQQSFHVLSKEEVKLFE